MAILTILVVEDEDTTFEILKATLENEFGKTPVKLLRARTLNEAKFLSLKHNPRIISTDVSLPITLHSGVDEFAGLEFVRFCRRRKRKDPVLIYTGLDVDEITEKLNRVKPKRRTQPSVLQKTPAHTLWAKFIANAVSCSQAHV